MDVAELIDVLLRRACCYEDVLCWMLNCTFAALGTVVTHCVKGQMGQTLTKLVQSLKNVVHPLPPPLLQP